MESHPDGRYRPLVGRKIRNQKPRAQLSCTSCRDKKLKCNRGAPCDNCKKRGIEPECHYNKISDRNDINPHITCEARIRTLESRIGHLEAIIQAQKNSNSPFPLHSSHPNEFKEAMPSPMASSSEQEVEHTPSNPTYSLNLNHNHWSVMMRRAHTELGLTEASTAGRETKAESATLTQSPTFLLGLFNQTPIENLIAALPSRNNADALVALCLDSGEPSFIIIHAPTFKAEYDEFWQNPTSAPRAWLALLFGVLGCAVWIQHSTDPEKATAAPPDEFFHYRSQCAISLASANCTTPGKYKVQASIIYAGMEYLQSSGSTTGMSLLVGMVSWQATMMGYHRDPGNHSHISPFDAEMRRRSWLTLSVMNCIVAWQTGLSPVVSKERGDTTYPRNLLDEDFGPATKHLPPSRSETTDISNITYLVALERMLSLANKITHLSDGQQSPENTTSLQQELDEAWSKVPSTLRSFNTSDNDGSAMVKIITLEITYQRARCILYRPYLASRKEYLSHQVFHFDCVDAASRILDCQIQMFQSAFSQPQYRYQAWFGVSRAICDCLTASMVVYLEIITSIKENESLAHKKSVKLIKSLKESHESWVSCPRPSLETVKAAELLGNMLNVISSLDMSATKHARLSKEGAWLDETQFNYDDYSQAAMWDTFTSLSSFDLIDWDLWDQEMQQLNDISTGNTYGRKGFPS